MKVVLELTEDEIKAMHLIMIRGLASAEHMGGLPHLVVAAEDAKDKLIRAAYAAGYRR
jgi:hypothetical protein